MGVLALLEGGRHHVSTVAATDSAGHIQAGVVAYEVACPALAAWSVSVGVDWLNGSKLKVLVLVTV